MTVGHTPAEVHTSEAEVRAALDTVDEPCSRAAGVRAGLSEFGLVSSIDIEPDPSGRGDRVTVVLRLTEPTCLMGHVFVPQAREALSAVPGVAAVDVTVTHLPGWSEDDLDPDYRRRLDAHRVVTLAPRSSGPTGRVGIA